MGHQFSVDYRIPFYEVDDRGQVKLPHLLSFCLDMSGLQSASLGLSDQKLFDERGWVWVVTDYDMTISRLPRYNETVRVTTEATAYNKFFCYRNFYIKTLTGEELLTIQTIFVLIDMESRKVQRVPESLVAPYGAPFTKEMLRGPKFAALLEATERPYHIRYFDLDMNGHVNNSKYLEWMYDVLEADFLRQQVPERIQLKYVKEVQGNGDILSRYQYSEQVSHHEITSAGTICAQAKIEWRKNDL
ncbi:acyl-ACP thioesterase domain-containing protein [Streptococcus sp. DD12]|uniref:acyl-ACP thioesterase domain-containing protein n=1 Tax=Streptococcus sp. DD12 TaxID=1777880 RepID=UPI0007985562|nr:acyl-ACP thioesterase domain-containing protein [Streptococcus sp. DD12]KXT76787.1 Acyl-ACP thioesterase [Streptococcus sp. DD12]